MMLVGDVKDRICILIDDLVDTGNTITRAAKLLKKEGATTIHALLTHGILSGDSIPRINASAIDKIIVTNTVPQDDHKRVCPKLESLDGKQAAMPPVYLTMNLIFLCSTALDENADHWRSRPCWNRWLIRSQSRPSSPKPSAASTTASPSAFSSNITRQ